MPRRPNILFVITHDTGRHIGGFDMGVSTPHLERLGAQGVRLRNLHCAAPQCSPSRASFVTGQMPHSNGEIGLTHRGFRIHPHVPTTPKLLRAAGYQALLFGMEHENPDPVRDTGYERWIKGQPRPFRCEDVTQQAIAFLDSGPQQPFFASVGFFETHRIFTDSGDRPTDDVVVPAYLPDTPETRRDFCDFNGDLARVDDCIGQLLEALDRNKLSEDTLVVYTTDHGVAFPGAKGTLFDPGTGIAAVLRGPGGFYGGRDCHALLSNIDFLPTFCDLAEVETPAEVQGRSLLPLANQQVDELHEAIHTELTFHAGYDPMRAVRTKTHKYIRSYEYRPYWFPPDVDDGYSKQLLADSWQFSTPRPRELLFDLVADPLEQTNVAGDPACAAVLADLRQRVDDHMQATDDLLIGGVAALPKGAQITPPTNWNPELVPDR